MSKIVPVPKEDLEKTLLATGLLYAINRFVLHPEGLVLAISYEDDDKEEKNPTLMLGRTEDGEPGSFDLKWEREECVPKLRAFLKDKVRPLKVLMSFYNLGS